MAPAVGMLVPRHNHFSHCTILSNGATTCQSVQNLPPWCGAGGVSGKGSEAHRPGDKGEGWGSWARGPHAIVANPP